MKTQYKSFHDWIFENLKEGSTLLEFGSGPGTIRFTDKYTVYSIEHDIKWVGHCKRSNYIYAPIKNRWYDISVLQKELPSLQYDMILVDGPTGRIGRKGLLNNLHLLDTKAKTMVFDDVNRLKEKELMIAVANKCNKKYVIHTGEDRQFAILT